MNDILSGLINEQIAVNNSLFVATQNTENISKKGKSNRKNSRIVNFDGISLALFLTLPLILIFAINPNIVYLSDGWWVSSILNTLELPNPQNPWFAGEPLTYPFLTLIPLTYIAKLLGAWTTIMLATILIQFLTVLAFYELAKEITKKNAVLATLMFFTFSSFLSGLVLIYDILIHNLGFPMFLKSVHGANYYLGLKFVGIEGLAIPNVFLMMFLPNLQILAIIGILYGLIKKEYYLSGLSLAVLVGCNPVLGLAMCLAFTGYLLYVERWGAMLPLIFSAITTIAINFAWFSNVLNSNATNGMFGLPLIGLLTMAVFTIAFSLIVMHKAKNNIEVFTWWSCFAVIIFTTYGYLYATIPLFMLGCLYSADWIRKQSWFLPFCFLSVLPYLLLIGTYLIYTPNIDMEKVQVVQDYSISPNTVVIECFPENETRWLHVYSSAFGHHPVYIADKQTALAYGVSEEKYNERLKKYYEICRGG